jgi:hypothetical protein
MQLRGGSKVCRPQVQKGSRETDIRSTIRNCQYSSKWCLLGQTTRTDPTKSFPAWIWDLKEPSYDEVSKLIGCLNLPRVQNIQKTLRDQKMARKETHALVEQEHFESLCNSAVPSVTMSPLKLVTRRSGGGSARVVGRPSSAVAITLS